jgi:TatD DNase family protein
MIELVESSVMRREIIAVGEAGLDKLRGPSNGLQVRIFEKQIDISEEHRKPLIIHCVRSWDDLLAAHKKKKPRMPWMIHGFRGSLEMGKQLVLKGMYISFWFEFVLRPESAPLLKGLPPERIFLETDGAPVDIKDIYKKVADDLEIPVERLKKIILENYYSFFKIP